MKQVIIGGYYNALPLAGSEYNVLCGGYTWDADPDVMAQAVGTAGTLRNLRAELDGVPGTGTFTFTLYRAVGTGAWGDTTLTCTVAADGTVASDTEHDVTVAAGDVICLKCTASSPDNARNARWTIMFEGNTANESLTLAAAFLPSAATYYAPIMGYGLTTVENDGRQICPTGGVLKNLYVQLEEDPGTDPDAYRFTLRVDGANSDDGEGNPLQCTITADARTGNDTTHEITVSAGDVLTFMSEPLNAPATNARAAIGMTFVADTDGESLIMGGTSTDLDDTATEYTRLVIHSSLGTWSGTEAQKYQLAQECTLKKLYVLLSGSPTGSYAFTVRLEGASSDLVAQVGDVFLTGNDTTHTVSVSDGEVVNMMVVPTGTPTVRDAYWGLVCFITGVVGEEYSKSLTEALAIVDTRLLSIGTIKSDVTTIADTFLRATTIKRVLSDTPTLVDTLTRQATIGRVLSDALSLADTLTKAVQFKRVLTGSLSLVDSAARNTSKAVSTSLTIADTLTRKAQYSRILTDAASIVDSIAKANKRVLSAAITLGDSILRASAKSITNALAVVDTFARRAEYGRTIADALTILDTPINKIRLYIDDTISLIDTVSKATARAFTETIDIADTIRKLRGRIIVYLHSRMLTVYLHSRSLAMKIHKGIPRGVRSSDE